MLLPHMIKSWKSAATRRFADAGKSRFTGLDQEKAKSRLQLLDAVQTMDEIPSLASIGLHKLKGNRKDQWAMTINGRWRLVFEFKNGDAYNVEIVDYH
jgi:proteic killer suppression protein